MEKIQSESISSPKHGIAVTLMKKLCSFVLEIGNMAFWNQADDMRVKTFEIITSRSVPLQDFKISNEIPLNSLSLGSKNCVS